jgi:tRNA threonylcarbamoyladenosine biosynthesis protein TsaB
LGIETCTPAGGVAIADVTGRLCVHRWAVAETGYSRRLMPMIDGAIADCEATKEAIAAVAVSHGPGSFTGVRLGIATAKTLAFALGVPLYTFSSLEMLARRWPVEGAVIAPVFDARRKEIYSALYRSGERGEFEILREEAVEPLSRFLEAVGETDCQEVWFSGDGAMTKENEIRAALGGRVSFVPPPWSLPGADAVALEGAKALAAGKVGIDPLSAAPVYLRSSDAERTLAQKRA